jgi:hypothetical protein
VVSVSGGGCDVIDLLDGADRRFRVRKANVDPDTGSYEIIGGPNAIMVVDIFAARVLGITEDAVPRLRLGPVTLLGAGSSTTLPPGGGFQPADEDDLGDEFDEGDSGDDTGEVNAS